MQLSSYSDKSDIESQKGNNGRHQYSATGSGAGRSGGKTMVAGSLASIPPDALYTTTSKHTSVSTLSSKPDHEYENLKVRLEDAMSWMGHRGIGGIVRSVSRRGRQDTQTQVIVNQAYQWRLKYLLWFKWLLEYGQVRTFSSPRAIADTADPVQAQQLSLAVAYDPAATSLLARAARSAARTSRSMPTWPTVNTIVWEGTSTVM